MSQVNVPLSNLRAVTIIIVVAFHSVLPYLASQPANPFPFDAPPYRWIAFPILDHERWFGFDLFCAWQDVSLMSLMFFLAGLFTPSSLGRKGIVAYLTERWWRIGLPFFLAVAFLSPLAYFASYRLTATDPSATAFWQHWLALPMWPAGPQWFLWQVFVLGALAAALHALAPHWLRTSSDFVARFAANPLMFFIGLSAASALAYVPLAMAFTPWEWTFLGPFSFQLSRPLHYFVYFLAGFAIGSRGLDHVILRSDGPLARHWPLWLAAAVASMSAWGGLTSLTMPDWQASEFAYRVAAALAFPVASAAAMLCLLAICLRLLQSRHRLLDSLSSNAYRIYLLHYTVVVWLQYALLDVDINAIGKAAIVFAGGLTLSLAASLVMSAGLKTIVVHHSEQRGDRTMVNQPR
ncbi:acyltransferase [Bradyrhizobium sp. WSM 1738]|uniref:acyltransferase family protein n=1 Tax=Bradyrhizobium hereditatis TaxID=2821405 RepID=UPI001CE38D2B|nr:acyltransferase [Bradyrhizobium hereditatis]MCA6116176.1 acyltransferase [Bradyrhizobium hereditatis]